MEVKQLLISESPVEVFLERNDNDSAAARHLWTHLVKQTRWGATKNDLEILSEHPIDLLDGLVQEVKNQKDDIKASFKNSVKERNKKWIPKQTNDDSKLTGVYAPSMGAGGLTFHIHQYKSLEVGSEWLPTIGILWWAIILLAKVMKQEYYWMVYNPATDKYQCLIPLMKAYASPYYQDSLLLSRCQRFVYKDKIRTRDPLLHKILCKIQDVFPLQPTPDEIVQYNLYLQQILMKEQQKRFKWLKGRLYLSMYLLDARKVLLMNNWPQTNYTEDDLLIPEFQMMKKNMLSGEPVHTDELLTEKKTLELWTPILENKGMLVFNLNLPSVLLEDYFDTKIRANDFWEACIRDALLKKYPCHQEWIQEKMTTLRLYEFAVSSKENTSKAREMILKVEAKRPKML